MRRGGPGPAHFGRSTVSGRVLVRVVALALAAAGAMLLAGGGNAFWLCVPAALLAASWSRTRVGATLAAAIVVAGAAADAKVDARILKRLGAGVDHPLLTAFPEGEYLKGLLLQIA